MSGLPANSVTVSQDGRIRPLGRSIATVARALWPRKTSTELAARSRTTRRQAERWLSERTAISSDALVDLLRSDEGIHFLEVLIADAQPAWWRSFRLRIEIEQQEARAAEAASEARRVLAQLKRGRGR